VDWPCEVMQDYAELNLGCKRRISSGLDWVFNQVEEAIILEDDCLPDSSFYPYAATLLERYRNESRVAFVGGTNFAPALWRGSASYRFSIHGGIWGWATWRRAWSANDLTMAMWPGMRRTRWCERVFGQRGGAYIREELDRVFAGGVDTWDYQWLFAVWSHDWCSVVPCTNLVSNIGHREDGTRTRSVTSNFANRPTVPLGFPLRHPASVSIDERIDNNYLRHGQLRSPRSLTPRRISCMMWEKGLPWIRWMLRVSRVACCPWIWSRWRR
jgi:hypothetical protein